MKRDRRWIPHGLCNVLLHKPGFSRGEHNIDEVSLMSKMAFY